MSYFKVDDKFHAHPKVKQIPRPVRAEAIGTWTLCGTWSSDMLTDGKIPFHMIDELGATPAGADALVAVRLWRMTRTAYVFVNWLEWQTSREDVEKFRASERERKRQARAKTRANTGEKGGSVRPDKPRNPTHQSESNPNPLTTKTKRDPSSHTSGDGPGDNSLPVLPQHPLIPAVLAVLAEGGREIPPIAVWSVVEFIDERRGRSAEPVKDPLRYYPQAIRRSWAEVLQFVDENALAS